MEGRNQMPRIPTDRLDRPCHRLKGGWRRRRIGRHLRIEHAFCDEEGERVGLRHDAVVCLRIEAENAATYRAIDTCDFLFSRRVLRVRTHDGSEAGFRSGETYGTEKRVGCHPRL